MTALFFSVLLLTYVVIPGVLFRRIFHEFVPLRRIQWSRTDELASFVITLIAPVGAAFIAVHYLSYFSGHPFGFSDSTWFKWHDYKEVLSASYSEKYFDENREMLSAAFERICQRQAHFLVWYYCATVAWACLCGYIGRRYGSIRTSKRWGRWAFIFEKTMIPAISEWHVMFTPFTFSRNPERWVQVDALSSDGTLYQGEAGLFHVGGDGKLTGFFLKSAKRFLRPEFNEAKKKDNSVSIEKYWRVIPGETFYLPFDKISNLNFTYFPKEALDELAVANLQKIVNIKTQVEVQASTTKIESTLQKQEEPKEAPISEVPTQPKNVTLQTSAEQKDFSVCPHCLLNSRPGLLPRTTADTPIISRSDGRTYHIYLQYGPKLQPIGPEIVKPGFYLAHFRYALDTQNIRNRAVVVLFAVNEARPDPVPIVRRAADKLAESLKSGNKLEAFYAWSNGELKPYKR